MSELKPGSLIIGERDFVFILDEPKQTDEEYRCSYLLLEPNGELFVYWSDLLDLFSLDQIYE